MRSVISKDGTSIAFDKSGEGPAVIMISGALTSRSANAPLATALEPHFTVFNYDRRGRGDSGNTAPYSVEREVEDIEALIDEVGGSVFVFGISSGAALALEAAAHGLKITKLALYELPFIVDPNGLRPPADHITQFTEMISSGRREDAVKFFMTKVVGMPAEAVAPIRDASAWPALEGLAHTLVYDAIIMGDYSLPTEKIASIKVPTIVIDGEKSDVRLRHAAQAVAETLSNAQHRTLKGQTHDAAPDVLAPVLVEFFST